MHNRDVGSQLSPAELAELAALADGTLADDRRAEVEAKVAASRELQALVARQRRSVLATRTLATDEPTPSLQAAVESLGPRHARRRRRAPRFALAGALAVATAVVAAVLLSGGPGAPTVADAARLAAESPTGSAPHGVGSAGTRLAVAVGGVTFPDFARA